MKRIAIAATAVVVALVAAVSAYAATSVNTYKVSNTFKGSKGSKAKPAELSFRQTITVSPGTAGDRTGILHSITFTLNNATLDPSNASKYTCTASTIDAASADTGCPKAAMMASGSITASIGPTSPFTTTATGTLPCTPELHVWNGGHHKLIFFFVDTTSHPCLDGAIQTGTVPPWTATYKNSGKNVEVTIPIPNSVDYPEGTSQDAVGSLSSETLNWQSVKQGSHYDMESTGCSGSKRKYKYSFNASLPSSPAQTTNVSGSSSCG